jgi:FkbM family methyltransferase
MVVKQVKLLIARILTLPIAGLLIRKLAGKYIISRGVKIDPCEKDIPDSILAALYWELYESSEMRLILKYLRKDLPVIELGGSIGVVTSLCGHITKERILSIEANPSFEALQKHILDINGVKNTSTLQCGIGYSEKPLYFIAGDTNISGRLSNTMYPGSTSIPIKTLSSILHENDLGDYILICDIEGVEHDLILKDGAALKQCRQLFIEFHEFDIRNLKRDLSGFLEVLESLGFTIRDSDGMVYYLSK